LTFVSGTTAAPMAKALHPGDAGAQAAEILQRIAAALKELGAGPEHVVETRIYLADMTTWEAVGRAHGAMFKNTRPATCILGI
jgi:enamine deaminase RidA (YjgF/YER057c/UK114 family)